MKFWDSSALIPLIVPEPETRALGALLRADPSVAAWWGTRLECAAALARLERERRITGPNMAQARSRLDAARRSMGRDRPQSAGARPGRAARCASMRCAPLMRTSSPQRSWPADTVPPPWSSSPLISASPMPPGAKASACFQPDATRAGSVARERQAWCCLGSWRQGEETGGDGIHLLATQPRPARKWKRTIGRSTEAHE